MNFRQTRFDGPEKFSVVVSIEVSREAALDAHLGGATLNRLDRLGNQTICGMEISVW
jgi:hypothetical protein